MEKDKKVKLYTTIAAIAAIAVILFIVIFVFLSKKPKDTAPTEKYPLDPKVKFLDNTEFNELSNLDFYSYQSDFYKDYYDAYKDQNPTIDNPMVIVNPFMFSPQTALIMFNTAASEKVKVTLKGKHDDDLVYTVEAASDHFIPVYGLYGNYDNTVILETDSGKSKTLSIKVETALSAGEVKVVQNDIKNSNGYFYFTTSSLGAPTAAYDNYGEVRWYLSYGYTKGMTMLSNGHMILSNISPGPDVTSTGGIVEVDMFGYVYREYTLSGGYHHDGTEMPNGNLIVLTSDVNANTFADYIVELDKETGKVVKDWRLTEAFSKVDPKTDVFYPTWGWVNSITYDQKSNCLILSVRNQNSVVALDYETGDIKWILGKKEFWNDKFDHLLIKGIGDDFIYPGGQHSVNITKEGYLSIFNNGYNANVETQSGEKSEVSCNSLRNNQSHAILYDIDFNNRTAKIVYKFGGKEYFSYALSSYTYSADGHKLFNSGWHMLDSNFENPNCTQFSASEYESYLIDFDENNKKTVELNIMEGKFEALKANIYNLAEQSVNGTKQEQVPNFKYEPSRRFTTEEVHYTKLQDSELDKYKKAELYDFAFGASSNIFQIYIVDSSTEAIKVTFLSNKGDGYVYTIKEAEEEGTEIDDINLNELPDGKYFVFMEYDGVLYNSTQYVIVNKGDPQ